MNEWIHFPFVPNLEHRAPFSRFLLSHRHTVGLLWTSDQPVISPSQRPLPTQVNTTYKHKRQTSMPWAGFEPATPEKERPQIYALDHAATGSVAKCILVEIRRRYRGFLQPSAFWHALIMEAVNISDRSLNYCHTVWHISEGRHLHTRHHRNVTESDSFISSEKFVGVHF
jgi:hypothetical protein